MRLLAGVRREGRDVGLEEVAGIEPGAQTGKQTRALGD
jgi:hypothetical protein